MQFQNMINRKLAVVAAIMVTTLSACIKNNYDAPPVDGTDPI